MDKKIYVEGLEEDKEAAINSAVGAVAGVSACKAAAMKAQILVTFDESVAGVEDAINAAISSLGVTVLN